jgi:hypothetical protein
VAFGAVEAVVVDADVNEAVPSCGLRDPRLEVFEGCIVGSIEGGKEERKKTRNAM